MDTDSGLPLISLDDKKLITQADSVGKTIKEICEAVVKTDMNYETEVCQVVFTDDTFTLALTYDNKDPELRALQRRIGFCDLAVSNYD